MGKKSSSAAKERRAAERAADREQKQRHGGLVSAFTEDALAEMRMRVTAAIPQLGAALSKEAVDVICLQTSDAYSNEHNEKLLEAPNFKINGHVGRDAVWDIFATSYKTPCRLVAE